jgi:predicted nucleotide-binding protein
MAAQRKAGPAVGQGRRVFLVHGRESKAREDLTALLKAFDLKVIEWREASAHAGGGTPYTGDIVAAGMELADAVVVLLTPDDIGYVRPAFRMDADGPHELEPTGQARLNVIFEAGMAVARDRKRVVLVQVGQVRKMSDIDGLNIIQLLNDVDRRRDLAQRLKSAGLAVDMDGEEWRTVGDFDRPALDAVYYEPASQDAATAEILGQDDAEYRVLCRIAEHFSQPGAGRLNTPFAVPGMTWDQIAVILRDLADARTAAIACVNVAELDYPSVITGLTQRGRGRLAAGR